MPDNPAGVYSLPPSYKVANGDLTDAAQHNPPFEDVEQALTNRLHKDGRTSWTGNQNANGKRLTGLGKGVDPQDAATMEQAASLIGDFKETSRTLDDTWLKRDGKLHPRSEFPDLAQLMPPLPDGVIWETKPTGATSDARIVGAGGQSPTRLFAATRNQNLTNSEILASVNGEPWSVRATISGIAPYGAIYGNNVYVIADANGKVAFSLDGDTWSDPAAMPSGFSIGGIDYGAGAFVVVGGNTSSQKAIWRSEDGVSWTPISPGGLGSGTFLFVRYINGEFLAGGTGGVLYTSPDGLAPWAQVGGITTSLSLHDAAYHDGIYIVVGGTGSIFRSTDRVGWTKIETGITQSLTSVSGNQLGFIVVGDGGVVRISNTSGQVWTASTTGLGGVYFTKVIISDKDPSQYIVFGSSALVLYGIRTMPTQFRTPSDDPIYGWIKAKP